MYEKVHHYLIYGIVNFFMGLIFHESHLVKKKWSLQSYAHVKVKCYMYCRATHVTEKSCFIAENVNSIRVLYLII